MNTFNSNNPRGGAWRGGGSSLKACANDMLYRFKEDGSPPRRQPLPLAETARGNLRKLTQMLQRQAGGRVDDAMGGTNEPTAAVARPAVEPYPFAAAARGSIHKLAQLLRDDVHQSMKSPAESGIAVPAARNVPNGLAAARGLTSAQARFSNAIPAQAGGAMPEPPAEEKIDLPSIDELLGPGFQKSGPRVNIDEVPCAVTPSVEASCRVKTAGSATVSDYVNSGNVYPALKGAVKHLYENSGYGPELLEFARQNDVRIVTDINAPDPARFYWEPMGVDENGKPKPGDKKVVINPNKIDLTNEDEIAFIIAHEIAQEKYGKDDPRNCTRFGTSEAWVEDVFEPSYLRDFPQVANFAATKRDPRTFQVLFKDFRNPEMKQEQKSAIMSRVFTEGLQHIWDMSQYPALPDPKCGKQKGKK